MKFSKFIFIPIYIAAMAASMQAIDQFLQATVFAGILGEGAKGYGWVGFQAWALYFLAGGNIKGGIKSFLSYVSGVVASILIMFPGGNLAPSLGFWSLPFVVLIVVIFVISLEKVPWFDFVPGVFVGAGAFFAFMSYVPGATFAKGAFTILFYCLFGLLYGFITVTIRVWYEAKVSGK